MTAFWYSARGLSKVSGEGCCLKCPKIFCRGPSENQCKLPRHVSMCVSVCVCTHTQVLCIPVYIYIYIDTCDTCACTCTYDRRAHTHLRMYVCMYVLNARASIVGPACEPSVSRSLGMRRRPARAHLVRHHCPSLGIESPVV